MKIPSREELERNKVHLEWLDIHGNWIRFDTFYDFATAVKHGTNRYLSTGTAHRIVDNKGRIIELFD
jgi:hypothetical protein|tara:strand:- start:125 stop:325 length:201 start_codon:yes stop_codon:yes gene_type:complete